MSASATQDGHKNSRYFYAYARSKSRVKNSVGPSTDDNGSLISTDKETEELLNDFRHLYLVEKTKNIS